jgi:polysaccharide biosynthesis protein PslG
VGGAVLSSEKFLTNPGRLADVVCRVALCLLLFAQVLGAQEIPLNPPIPDSLGVNIHFMDPASGEMQELAASGARWIRMDFFWADTERTKGRYDFSQYDRLLATLDRYDIRPIFILDYGNKLYDHGLAPYTDTGRQAFANWAAAAVRHFQGRGVVWEMWNEPNGFFWKPKRNVQNYILLALAVGEAIREAEPGATYIGPAGAIIDFPFLKACFRAGLLNYWDGVSVHPYRQRIPETVIPVYARLRRLISQYAPRGKAIPIISGEWGYPSLPSWWGMNDQRQANMLAREWLTNIASGVAISIWYDWHDGPTPTDPGSHCGLVSFAYHAGEDPVFAPKPAYLAARTLTHALDGYSFRARLEVGGPDDYVLLFTRGKLSQLVVWTPSATPHEVRIPRSRGRFQVTELEGQKGHALHAHRHELAITLTDAPQYLIPRKANQLNAVSIER